MEYKVQIKFFGGNMRKSLTAILVLFLSMMGANALAAKLDGNVEKAASQTTDTTGGTNDGNRTCGTKAGM